MMEQRINQWAKFLLMFATIASAQEPTTIVPSPAYEYGSGDSYEGVQPYNSLDSNFLTEQEPSTTVSSTIDTGSGDSIVPISDQTSHLSIIMAQSLITSTPTTSTLFSPTPVLVPPTVFNSTTSVSVSTTSSFSSTSTIISNVTPSTIFSPTGILSITVPPTSNSTNLTTVLMVDDNTGPTVPLPVLIAVPVGVVVLISVLFILIVICCMRYRKRRKYTIKTSNNNRLSDYAPRSVTPVVPDMDTTVDSKKRVSKFEDKVADTLGIDFPETPKYGSNEDIPALIILNPVKPNIEPLSNSLWSRTLPTRQKIRKDTCSESDVPDQPDSGLMKPAKSANAIDTLTLSTEMANKSTDGTSMTLLLPEAKRKTSTQNNPRHDYDHLLSEEEFIQAAIEMEGEPSSLESTGYVFLEPANSSSEKKQKKSSAPDRDVELEAKKDLKPSSMPVPSQPPQHMLPIESIIATAESESIYDTPRSSGMEATSPKESKQSTSSGSCSSARDITSSVEYPSHYDVPKSALLAYRQEAAKHLGFSGQPNAVGAQEASLVRLNSPQEYSYDSMGAGSLRPPYSPPCYDIPKLLLQTQNRDQKLDNSEVDLIQETNMDDVESSDEHVYCVPPDVAVNMLKTHKSRVEASKAENTETANTSASKPVPKKRKKNEKNDNTTRNSVVPAPRQAKKVTRNTGLGSVTSSQEELLDKPESTSASVVPAPRPVKKAISNSSDSVFSSQEKLLDKPETKGDVPATRPAKLPILNDLPRSGSVEQDLSELKSKSDVSASSMPITKPVMKKPTKTSPIDSVPSSMEKATSPATTSRQLARKPAKNSPSSVTSSTEKLLTEPEPKNSTAVKANMQIPATSIKPAKKPTKNSPSSVSSSMEKLLNEPESKSNSSVASISPAPKPVKKHIHGKSSSDAATPGPMVAKEPEPKGDTAKVAPAPRPVVAKKSALLARTASLEELLSKTNDDVVRPVSPKPAVAKKLAVRAKMSSGSTTGSLDDLRNQPELKNNRATPLRPVVAKKPSKLQLAKKSSSSVSSSAEDLLSKPEPKKATDVQSIAVNGNGPDSDLTSKSKPKPKIIPRSQSRHAIVQEQGDTTNSNLPSPTVAPGRPPTIPLRPVQRPPPIPQRPELKPPINA